MSEQERGTPRTGTGDAPRGRKPHSSELRMLGADGGIRSEQPKGWGIAKVLDIITGRERR